MPQEACRRDRLVGLFALGLIQRHDPRWEPSAVVPLAGFNPPTLWIFASSIMFGWPFLFVYLFCAWAALTAMIALTIERRRTPPSLEVD